MQNSEKVYFFIEGEELFLDQVLIEDELIPVFYICKSTKNERFLVLCTNEGLERYILTKISKSKLCDLLQGKVPMCDAILSEPFFWDVQVGKNIESDVVKRKNINEIPSKVLPHKDTYYEVSNMKIRNYLKQINKEVQI